MPRWPRLNPEHFPMAVFIGHTGESRYIGQAMFRVALPTMILPLAACAFAAAGGPSSPLAQTRWRFTAIDAVAPVAAGATLEFQAGRLSASVGCNGMGGEWRIERGRLIAGPFVSTQMWCEGVMEQERAVATLLAGGPEVKVNGTRMTLTSGGHSAQLVRD